MNLFCARCKENHEFAPHEVERLVYAIQAELGDLQCTPPVLPASDDPTECLKIALAQWGNDSEMYQEWVDGLVEQREKHETTEQEAPNGIAFTQNEAENLTLLIERIWLLLDFHTERAITDESADDLAEDGQLLTIELAALLADLKKRTGLEKGPLC